MANYHSVSFAIAGSKEAVNRAILLMAKNIASRSGSSVKEFDDPEASFKEYKRSIEQNYYAAFAGADSQDSYIGETVTVSFGGNDKACVLGLRYSTAWRLNADDIDTFTDILAKTCAFEAIALHADEGDDYDQLRVNTYSADGSGECGGTEDDEWPTAGQILGEYRRVRRCRYRKTDPEKLARASAVSMWEDWYGDSVFETVWEAGVFGEDVDEDDAREIFDAYSYEVAEHYALGRKKPFDPDDE